MKAQPFQYSSLAELVERADKKSRAMEAANSASARIAARPLFIALDASPIRRTWRGHPFRSRIRRERRDPAGTSFRFGHRSRMEGVRRRSRAHAGRPRGEPHQSH